MTTVVYRPHKGRGTLYLKKKDDAAGLLRVGNVSELTLTVTEQVEKLINYESGGTYARDSFIESIGYTYKVHDLDRVNLARALSGTATEQASASITDEVHIAYQGALVPLAYILPSAVVVTDNAGTTTYAVDDDYQLRNAGLFIVPGGAITDGGTIKVDYTYAAQERVDALTTTAAEYELLFDGLNRVAGGSDIFGNAGKPLVLNVYRGAQGAAKEIAILSENFGELVFEGEMLLDSTKTGAGVSQYVDIRQAA